MKTANLIYQIAILGLLIFLLSSCKKEDGNKNTNTVVDIEGNVYHTVTIGTQIWMVENLKTTKYRNGETIPNVTDNTQWFQLQTGALCNYNNDISIGNKYGKIYNWFAVQDYRKIAPTGWHVPSEVEWNTLINFVAANLSSFGLVAKALSSKTDWESSTAGGAVGNDLAKNNTSGFEALPGGQRYQGGQFIGLGKVGTWWTTFEGSSASAWMKDIVYDNSDVYRNGQIKNCGFYIRCVRD